MTHETQKHPAPAEVPFLFHDFATTQPGGVKNLRILAVGRVTLRPWCDVDTFGRRGDKAKLRGAISAARQAMEASADGAYCALLVSGVEFHDGNFIMTPNMHTLRQYAPAAGLKFVHMEGGLLGRDWGLLAPPRALAMFPKWVLHATAARLILRDVPVCVTGEPPSPPTHKGGY